MSKISVKKNSDNPIAVLTKPEEEVIPFSPQSSGIAGLRGEFNVEDRKLPFLSIIQGVGENAAKYKSNHGDLLYNKETIVPRPVTVSFYGVRKYYKQNLAFDSSGVAARPLTFDTAEQVLERGGNLRKYITPGSDENNYVPEAFAFVALESPKDGWGAAVDYRGSVEKVFVIPAVWILSGTRYRRITPLLLSVQDVLIVENKELAYARFSLDTQHEKIGGNWVYSAVVTKQKDGKRNSDAYVQKLHEMFGE